MKVWVYLENEREIESCIIDWNWVYWDLCFIFDFNEKRREGWLCFLIDNFLPSASTVQGYSRRFKASYIAHHGCCNRIKPGSPCKGALVRNQGVSAEDDSGIEHILTVYFTCSYDIPVVKDTVTYADSLLKSYALTAAALARAEAVAISLYKTAGEPIQARLQGQVRSLGLYWPFIDMLLV